MFSLTVSFGPAPQAWVFMFRDKEKAEHTYQMITQPEAPTIMIADDFEQRAFFKMDQINGIMLEDMQQSQLAYIERVLHQARGNAKSQEAAQSDQMLRTAMLRQQGQSPILTPMGAPNGRGF